MALASQEEKRVAKIDFPTELSSLRSTEIRNVASAIKVRDGLTKLRDMAFEQMGEFGELLKPEQGEGVRVRFGAKTNPNNDKVEGSAVIQNDREILHYYHMISIPGGLEKCEVSMIKELDVAGNTRVSRLEVNLEELGPHFAFRNGGEASYTIFPSGHIVSESVSYATLPSGNMVSESLPGRDWPVLFDKDGNELTALQKDELQKRPQ